MTKTVKIVIPTPKNQQDFDNSQTLICLKEIVLHTIFKKDADINITIKPVLNNKQGLSELYQDELNQRDADYMVFMHDDLEIHDHFFIKKLLKAHESYDVVGLAGATTQNYNTDKPMVWHLCREKVEDSRGIVNHFIPKGFNGVQQTHINSAYFGPTPSSVVVIDGLFMSFKMSSLQDKEEVFDRQFTFHHYDMGMCCKAYDLGLKIGVWPIFVVHHGLGEFANDKTWQKHAIEFKQKYSNKIMRV